MTRLLCRHFGRSSCAASVHTFFSGVHVVRYTSVIVSTTPTSVTIHFLSLRRAEVSISLVAEQPSIDLHKLYSVNNVMPLNHRVKSDADGRPVFTSAKYIN